MNYIILVLYLRDLMISYIRYSSPTVALMFKKSFKKHVWEPNYCSVLNKDMLRLGCFRVQHCRCFNLLLQRPFCVTGFNLLALKCSFLTFHLELVLTGPGRYYLFYLHVLVKKMTEK